MKCLPEIESVLLLLLGTGKELYDRKVKRTYFSGNDLTWDLIGSLLGSLAGASLADE